MINSSVNKCLLAALMLGWNMCANAADIVPDDVLKVAVRRDIPNPLYGVTVDSVDNLQEIVTSLQSLARKPTARIVFDEVPPAQYVTPVSKIHEVSYVMGELLDSYYFKKYSVAEYSERTRQYLDALGSNVDIWEVGNEINGAWLGDTPTVVAKMTTAYDLVKERNGRTALTLYHDQSSEGMLAWANEHVPQRMKQGLDYVLVSFYEDDQGGIKPDWPMVFGRLAKMFPNSKIGFGEVGTKHYGLKESYIDRYYTMQVPEPNFVGGYFWWYFKQDMVPNTKPLWRELNNVLARGVVAP